MRQLELVSLAKKGELQGWTRDTFKFNIPHLTLFAMGDLAPWLVAGFPPTRSSMPVLSLWTDIATRMPLQGKGPKIPFQLTTLGWNTLLSRKLKLSSGAWFLKGLKMSETQRRPLYRIPCKVDTNQIKLSTAARYRTCIPCSSLSLASVRLPKRASNLEPMTNNIRWPDPFFPKLALSRLTTQQFASLSGSTALFIHFQSLGEAPVDEAIPASYCKPKYAKAGGGCRMNQYNFLLLIRMPLRRFSLLLLHCS